MKNSSAQIERKILKGLEPLNRLNPILLDELAAKSIVEEVPAGRIICRHGEKDSRQIYLLSGQIEVAAPGDAKPKVIKTKSALKTAVAEGSPRTATLKAKTVCTLLHIDSDLLELLMSDEPQLTAAYEVSEISVDQDNDDWMLTFLQSPAFLQLPTENIQKLLTHMDELPVQKDQVVIQQGNKDENYYIIKSGSCSVHRKPYENSANVLLAVLPTGSGFGEEALISNGTRNATITMRENGKLMRLKKKDFLELLINPLITYYEYSETKNRLDNGSLIIDVRSEQQAKEKPVQNSVNIPLSMLRMKFDSLNAEREYLLVCDDSSQSAAAAFLMIQGGLLNCRVLKGGLKSATNKATNPTKTQAKKTSTSEKAKEQIILAKKQTIQLAAQQEQIKAAREKSELDIIKHKKELSESRERIAKKNQHTASNHETETAQLKVKATEELAKAQAETKAIELRQEETTQNILRAEEMMKQSQAAAEETRKQATKEAALIKQRAVEEAEQLRAEEMIKQTEQTRKEAEKTAAIAQQRAIEKEESLRAQEQMKQAEQARAQAEKAAEIIKQRAVEEAELLRVEKVSLDLAKAQAEKAAEIIKQRAIEEAELLRVEKVSLDLAKAQAEKEAIELRQQETDKAMRQAEALMKKSAATAEQAEKEAALIKQRAVEEAEYLRAEVASARLKMEQDAAQLKVEEELIKKSALKVKQEADEIRRAALNDAKQVRTEIEETRALLSQKLQQTQEEEKLKQNSILAEAKKQADQLSATKTQQAELEAKTIRQKAQQDALRLHDELEQTRKQIEAEAARTIAELKQQSELALINEQEIHIIEEEVVVELVADGNMDYKSVSIPGISSIEPNQQIDEDEAQRKAEEIKAKLTQSQEHKLEQQPANVKVHKSNDRTILEGDDDLFIFKEPETSAKIVAPVKQPVVSQRTQAESALTQISTEQAQKSVVIFPQQEQETSYKNQFLNQEESHTATSYNIPQFDKEAYLRKNQSSNSNTLAIAASFLMILAGAVFTLHATDTLKVQSIAALFNSGNDTTAPTTAIAKTKTIRKKVLRADTKVNIKKKVGNKMDDIMQGWQDVLTEAKNPKKAQNNQ